MKFIPLILIILLFGCIAPEEQPAPPATPAPIQQQAADAPATQPPAESAIPEDSAPAPQEPAPPTTTYQLYTQSVGCTRRDFENSVDVGYTIENEYDAATIFPHARITVYNAAGDVISQTPWFSQSSQLSDISDGITSSFPIERSERRTGQIRVKNTGVASMPENGHFKTEVCTAIVEDGQLLSATDRVWKNDCFTSTENPC
ncbi:MAG: hypothetical protein JW834_04650 [Candidatus Diapherotrites archaeon]|nr:hypothetical protein [Candidatus Diapherotrites archaeon]